MLCNTLESCTYPLRNHQGSALEQAQYIFSGKIFYKIILYNKIFNQLNYHPVFCFKNLNILIFKDFFHIFYQFPLFFNVFTIWWWFTQMEIFLWKTTFSFHPQEFLYISCLWIFNLIICILLLNLQVWNLRFICSLIYLFIYFEWNYLRFYVVINIQLLMRNRIFLPDISKSCILFVD